MISGMICLCGGFCIQHQVCAAISSRSLQILVIWYYISISLLLIHSQGEIPYRHKRHNHTPDWCIPWSHMPASLQNHASDIGVFECIVALSSSCPLHSTRSTVPAKHNIYWERAGTAAMTAYCIWGAEHGGRKPVSHGDQVESDHYLFQSRRSKTIWFVVIHWRRDCLRRICRLHIAIRGSQG